MSFEALADVYDALAYDTPASDWADYLLSLYGKKRGHVPEYGCGTGRITEHLVRAGLRVTAVDSSGAMLTQAAQKLRPLGGSVQLAEADMTTFRLNCPADLAVAACDVVNYLTTKEALDAFFAAAAANLVPGGQFLFDISSRNKLEEQLGDQFYYDDGDDETLFWQNACRRDEHLLTMDLTIFRRMQDGRYERLDEQQCQRAWTAEEIEGTLSAAGFTNVRTLAFGTSDTPPGERADRIQFAAVR